MTSSCIDDIDETFVPNYDASLLDDANDAFFDWLKKVDVIDADDNMHVCGNDHLWFYNVCDDESGVFYNADDMTFGFYKHNMYMAKESDQEKKDNHVRALMALEDWLWLKAKVSFVFNYEDGSLLFINHKPCKKNTFECYIVQRKKMLRLKSGKYYYELVPLMGPIKNDYGALVC